jgi:hypothetical protein
VNFIAVEKKKRRRKRRRRRRRRRSKKDEGRRRKIRQLEKNSCLGETLLNQILLSDEARYFVFKYFMPSPH